MIVKGLVNVRSGSQRIKNKNIRPFADSSLLEIKLQQLKRIKQIDSVVVSSDSDEYLDIAKNLGVETFKRDAYYASNTVSPSELFEYSARHVDCDVIIDAPVTFPLLKDSTLEEMITLFKQCDIDSVYDSVSGEFLVRKFLMLNQKPIGYDGLNHPNSQNLPRFSVSCCPIITRRLGVIERKSFLGYKPYFYEISEEEGLDIDTPLDFEFAEYLYKKRHNVSTMKTDFTY